MAQMGYYCKAYPIQMLRAYPSWTEQAQNTRKETKKVDGKEQEVPRSLKDDDILYLQENFVVTDGIYQDENVVFDAVTEEWKSFCRGQLDFDEKAYERIQASETAVSTTQSA